MERFFYIAVILVTLVLFSINLGNYVEFCRWETYQVEVYVNSLKTGAR